MSEEKTDVKNIYEKMAAVKTKLLGIKKGGKNEFSHYSYFELGDILPVLTPALQQERLFMQTIFSASEQIAKLVVVDIDNTESKLEFEIRFAECALKGAHEIQNLGAAQTYTRRYLIMTAFDIAEADIVDGGAEKDEKKPEQKKIPPKNQPAQSKPEAQQQPAPPAPQEDVAKLKRDIWELIKMLPNEQQPKWLNSCKEANEKTLAEIKLMLLDEIHNSKEQDDLKTAIFERMCAEALALVKKIPEASRGGWIDAIQGAACVATIEEILFQLREKVAVYEEVNRQPSKKPAPQDKPADQPEKELEIY